jgi:hypothetical protein
VALNIVARKVEVAKANNGGVLKYRAMTDIVNSMKPTLPWLTTGMLRNHVNKLNKEKLKRDPARPTVEDVAGATANNGGESTSTLSALTLDTGGNSDSAMGATSSNDDNVGGRPKGSSADSKRDLKRRERLAMLEATRQYQDKLMKKRKSDGSNTRLKHGTLATIIEKAKALYNVVENSTINPSTIRSRCKRNHINPVVAQGTTSPMAAVEPYLIAVILQLARMRCPINATMGLHLANSMIEGTDIAKAIMAMREKRKKQRTLTMQESSSSASSSSTTTLTAANTNNQHRAGEEQPTEDKTKMLLGTGYWNRFMRRHRHIIRSKCSVKF